MAESSVNYLDTSDFIGYFQTMQKHFPLNNNRCKTQRRLAVQFAPAGAYAKRVDLCRLLRESWVRRVACARLEVEVRS